MQIHTPEWVHHAVFYQIFPDRFAISPRVSKPNNLQDWDSPPTIEGYKGGDLIGVVEHLDHIQELGCNAIYFTPVFQSASNHRYHTHDYGKVDPLLGGNDALRVLLDECHARNIKVVLDGVFNHASRGFFQFNDILENGPHSPYLDWFFIEDWPLSAYDGAKPANYGSWIGNRALPKFNTDNPQVREFIMQVAEFWLDFGIDGWRLDVPFEISTPGFWQEFRERVKARNPDAYIVGEVWQDSREWLQGDQFDAVMNYLFTGPTIAYTAGPRVIAANVEGRSYDTSPALSAREYGAKIEELLALYDWQIQLAQLNLLDSHDTARLLGIAGGDKTTVRLATILLMTYPGAPSVFYGDEIGLPGDLDPNARRGMPWHRPEDWDLGMLAFHKHLIAMRHAHAALRTGSYHQLYADDAVYAFVRVGGDETIIVAVNVASEPRTVDLPVGVQVADGVVLKPLYGESGATCANGVVRITIPARDGVVIG